MSNWSYSSYSAAVRCLRYYKLCYVDKIVPKVPESGDLIFGSALHSAINASLTGQDGPGTFEVYWMSYKDKEIDYGRFNWSKLAELGAKFIKNFGGRHAERYDLKFAETRVYANYKGVALEGTPDFYGTYDGRLSLRDFKTSSRAYESEKSTCALQLYLYTYLVSQNGMALPETLGYTVFNKGTGFIQDLTWEFKESDMKEALDNLVEYCGSIDISSQYPKNFNACLDYGRKCQYWNICHGDKEGGGS